MLIKTIVIIIIIISVIAAVEECLPKQCKLIESALVREFAHHILCTDLNNPTTNLLDHFNRSNPKCSRFSEHVYTLHISSRDRHHKLLEPSSSLVFQLGKQMSNNQSNAPGIVYRFLEANSAWIVSPDSFVVFTTPRFISIQIFGSILFYDHHLNAIKSCQDLFTTNNTIDLDLEFPFRSEQDSSQMEVLLANLADRQSTICPQH